MEDRRQPFLLLVSLVFGRPGMNEHTVVAKLKAAETELKAKGVLHAALFGSVARGENGSASDIDIMIEIAPDADLGIFEYVGVVNYIGGMFPMRVDVSNRECMKAYVRPSAERDAIYAF